MKKTWFDTQFPLALTAGQERDYRKAITILEDLAARGYADGTAEDDRTAHPEVYLYLARSWHAERMSARAATCARAYVGLCPDDGAGWFFLGRIALSDGLVARAVAAFQRSVSLNPESVDARAALGAAYLKMRKPSLARATFEEALRLAPGDERLNHGYRNALFVEAVRTLKRGDAETARQMLTFLIDNDLDGVAPRLYLAHALRELGYRAEALSQYEAALEFAPDDEALRWYPASLLLEMGETARAGELIAALGGMPGDRAPSTQAIDLTIVRGHLEAGEWGKAAQAARMYIKTYGPDAQVHALMGEAQRNLGKYAEAINHFRRSFEIDKSNPAPLYGVILAYVASGDWEGLKAELVRARRAGLDEDTVDYYAVIAGGHLDADPERLLPAVQDQVRRHGAEPDLVSILARTYFRLGLADLAIGWYEKSVALEPGNEEARLGLIACLETLGSTDALDEAYAAFLSQWGDNESIRREYVTFLAKVGKWAEAADQLEFLSRESASEAVLRQLAFYRRKAGQFRSAAILYRDMLRKKPDNRVLLGNLVFCLDRMGQAGLAARLMAEANKAFKPDAESMLIEGVLRARAGDDAGALAVFRKVIDRYPKDPRGWERVAAIYRRKGVGEMAATFEQKARELGGGNRSHGSGSHSGAIWSPSGREATPLAGGTPARRKPAQAKKAPVAKKPPTTKKSSPKKAAPKKAATKAKTVKAKPAQAKKKRREEIPRGEKAISARALIAEAPCPRRSLSPSIRD